MSVGDRLPRRGEIWYAFTPGHPRDPHQPRPVLIVSEDVRNSRRDDCIVIPVFSRGRLGPTRLLLPAGAGGVLHEGVLFCELVTTIDRDFLEDGPLGEPVPDGTMAHVVRAARRALGEVVPEPIIGQ